MVDKLKLTETGSVMITVLALLVLISLGAGIVMMFGTSTLQMAEHNIELRATNVAEAGFRYAAGEYRSAGNLAAKFNRLQALDQEQVTLLNNEGTFQLSVFPYWFVTTVGVTNATALQLNVPGRFPNGFRVDLEATGTGNVNINDDFYTYTGGTATLGAGVFDPDQFSLTLNQPVTLPQNTSVQIAFVPTISQTVNTAVANSVLTLNTGLGNLFPARNGLIEVWRDSKESLGTYSYRNITIDNVNTTVSLNDIAMVKDGQLTFGVTAASFIVIKKQAIIQSAGSAGAGNVASNKELALSVFLTDEEFIAADTPAPLDLGGPGLGKHEDFNDEENGQTTLKNWEFSNPDNDPESDLKTVTTQAVATEFGSSWTSTNYVTFQNFTEVDQASGYTMELIDKDRIPASVRTNDLHGIWGNASDNIYFVGKSGTILHFDGSDFTTMTSTTTEDLNAIWGLPAQKTNPNVSDNIFVVGNNGETLIYEDDQVGWVHASHGETDDIYAAWGISWGHFDGYGEAGTNPYNWDSANTANVLSNYNWYINEFGRKVNFRCLWAIAHTYPYFPDYGASGYQSYQNIMVGEFSGDVISAGAANGDGIIMHEFYTPAVIIPGTPLRGIWGSSFSDIYAVGDSGAIYHNTSGNAPDYENNSSPLFPNSWQGKWIKVPSGDVPTSENLNGVYGNDANDFYVIGDNGTVLYNKGNGFELVPTNGVTTQNLNSIWGSDRTGIYAVGNDGTILFLGYPTNKIGGLILPLSKNTEIATKWGNTQKYLSYSIQVKTVWGDDLDYGTSGICFRWHQPEAGKYAGYGISFMRYDSSLNSYNDMIPDDIKPAFKATVEKNDRLLIVLWEQYVQGGAEHRRWIAYKDITDDTKANKALNGTPRDLSSLFVRVHEKSVEGQKVNDINIYYGNASAASQSSDDVYNNTTRNRYNPTFVTGSNTIKWPVFDLDQWTDCPNQGITCEEADAFTLVDNVSVAAVPLPANGTTKYWIVNPAADLAILKNNFTIRARRFTSPDGSVFGSQSDRSEIGLHVFGDIGDAGSQSLVSFTEFAVQLGVDADAVDADSSFGGLQ